MKLVYTNSLAKTLDSLNEAFFFNIHLSKTQKEETAKWLISRRGKAGSYAGMFAPTELDFSKGAKLFTGEVIRSNAATGHILGEETCRALIRLGIKTPEVKDALKRATNGMLKRLYYDICAFDVAGTVRGRSTSKGLSYGDKMRKLRGMYCCGICSVSYWRHLAVGGLDYSEKRLVLGMKDLKSYRDGKGGWRRFPFYYTLLSLNEINLKPALDEMRYAVPVLERYLKRASAKTKISERRWVLAERILTKV
jgi:hypothetical protein